MRILRCTAARILFKNDSPCIIGLRSKWGREMAQCKCVVLVWSVIERLMVRASCLPFALTMLTNHILTASHQLAPASAFDWFNKGHAMCYYVCVIMHVKDP